MPVVRARGRFADMTAAIVAAVSSEGRAEEVKVEPRAGVILELDAFLPHSVA